MKLELKRMEFGTDYTIGRLFIDGVYFCYTLEDKVREIEGIQPVMWKVLGSTAIPKGSYRLVRDMSTRFGREMFHVLYVPGFSGIRIHSGNTDKDTEGCILVGLTWSGNNFIGSSRLALQRLEDLLKDQKDMTLDVTGYPF